MQLETRATISPEFLWELTKLILALTLFTICLGLAGRTFDFDWFRPQSNVTIHMDAGHAPGPSHPGAHHAHHRKKGKPK